MCVWSYSKMWSASLSSERRSLREIVYATQPKNFTSRLVAEEELSAEDAPRAGVHVRDARLLVRRIGALVDEVIELLVEALDGHLDLARELLLEPDARVERSVVLQVRRAERRHRLVRLRRLVIDADAALDRGARIAARDVVARREARARDPLTDVARVMPRARSGGASAP